VGDALYAQAVGDPIGDKALGNAVEGERHTGRG
jgi:hypothetical protein